MVRLATTVSPGRKRTCAAKIRRRGRAAGLRNSAIAVEMTCVFLEGRTLVVARRPIREAQQNGRLTKCPLDCGPRRGHSDFIGSAHRLRAALWPYTHHPAVGSGAKFDRPMWSSFRLPSSPPFSRISSIGPRSSVGQSLGASAWCNLRMTTSKNDTPVRSLSPPARACAGGTSSTIAPAAFDMGATRDASRRRANLTRKKPAKA